jgi:2TM domain-containing protein
MDEMPVPEIVGEPRKAAIERLKNRRSFAQHVVSYVVVNAFLIGIWFATGGGYFWPAWVLGGWGIGLVLHAWTAFFQRPITEADVAREMKRGGSAVE